MPSRLPYPQGHVLSKQQGLSTAEYTHRNENRFINGVVAQIDKGASVRDNNQLEKMTQTRAEDRINDVAPMSAQYPIVGPNAYLLRRGQNNVTMASAIDEGDDQSHHSFASDTPSQGAPVSQNLFC